MADSGRVIDRLVVELGLDPSGIEEGRKQAAATWLKTQDDAKKSAKAIQDDNKKTADSFNEVTKSALALFGVLVGAKDLSSFVAGVVQTDAAVGRLAGNLGLSARNLQQWQAAAQRMGGTAEGMSASISTANSQIVGLRTNGQALPPGVARLFASAGMSYNPNWTTQQYLVALAQASHSDVGSLGQQTVSTLLQQSGFTPDYTNLAISRGGSGLQSYLNTMPTVSNGTIGEMQKLQNQWAKLQQTYTQFFSTMVGDFGSTAEPFLKDLQTFGDNLVKAEPTLALVAKDTASIAKSLGGWRVAIEGLVALWAGGKVVGILSALRGLLGGAAAEAAGATAETAGGAAAGAGVGAAAGTLAAGAGLAWLLSTGPAGAGEGDAFRAWRAQQGAAGYTPGATYDPTTGTYSTGSGPVPLAPSGAGTKGWWTPARQAWAYKRLRAEAGLSDQGARALISRWMNVESPGGPTSVNPTSGAYGIGQWLGGRLPGIAGDSSPDDQLSYAIKELNGSEKQAGDALRAAATPQQGATGASMYERAGGYSALTGTDNFTAKTLAGMSSVVTSAGAALHLHSHGPSSSTTSIKIDKMSVNTQARDADGIFKSAHGSLMRAARARPANYGQV